MISKEKIAAYAERYGIEADETLRKMSVSMAVRCLPVAVYLHPSGAGGSAAPDTQRTGVVNGIRKAIVSSQEYTPFYGHAVVDICAQLEGEASKIVYSVTATSKDQVPALKAAVAQTLEMAGFDVEVKK